MQGRNFMKKLLCVMLIALLCVGCGSNESKEPNTETEMNSQNSESSEKVENEINAEYAQAYIDAIRTYESTYSDKECTYALIYVDDNEIPELVAGVAGQWVSLYTYGDGKLHTLIDGWGYGVGGNPGYMYLERQNIIYNENADFAGDLNYYYHWEIKKNYKLEDYYSGELVMSAFKDADGNGIPTDDEILATPIYTYDGEEITKEEFQSYMFEGEYELIVGELSASEIISDLEKLLGKEDSSEEVEGKELSTSEYQALCSDMMDTASAYGSRYEEMAVYMADLVANAQILSDDSSYRVSDISDDVERTLMFQLIWPHECNDGPVYSLEDYRDQFPDYAVVYKKDELLKVFNSFYGGESLALVNDIVDDLGDYVGYVGASGGPWEYFDTYDIKENDDYVLIHAACYYGHNGGANNVYHYTANILFEKAADSIFGLRLVYVEGYNNDLTSKISSITASSQLANYGSKTYGAENLIDDSVATAWVENVSGVGVGEYIIIKLREPVLVQEVGICNGYQATEDTVYNNGYVTRFSVDFGNGVVKEVSCGYIGYNYGERNLEKVSLDKPVYTDTIIITILEAETGSKYSDTCISEIEIY